MVGVVVAILSDLLYRLLEINWFAQGRISKSVGNYRSASVVVYVKLNTLYTSLKILDVSLYFRVAGQLVASEVGVVRRIAEIVSEGQTVVNFIHMGCVIDGLVF